MLYASQLEEEEAKRREEEAFQKQIQEIEQRELSHYEDYDSDLETLLKEQMPIDTEQQVEEVDQLIAQRAAENNTNTIVVNPAAIIEINKLYEALQQSEPGEQNASEQLALLRRKLESESLPFVVEKVLDLEIEEAIEQAHFQWFLELVQKSILPVSPAEVHERSCAHVRLLTEERKIVKRIYGEKVTCLSGL
jgi:hypothetical protein